MIELHHVTSVILGSSVWYLFDLVVYVRLNQSTKDGLCPLDTYKGFRSVFQVTAFAQAISSQREFNNLNACYPLQHKHVIVFITAHGQSRQVNLKNNHQPVGP